MTQSPALSVVASNEGLSYLQIVKRLRSYDLLGPPPFDAPSKHVEPNWADLHEALLTVADELGFVFEFGYRDFELNGYKLPYRLMDPTDPTKGAEVVCFITIHSVTREMPYPISDKTGNRLLTWDSGDVDESRMRAYVKACALHGLGLSAFRTNKATRPAPSQAPEAASPQGDQPGKPQVILSDVAQQALTRLKAPNADLKAFRQWFDSPMSGSLSEQERHHLEEEYDLVAAKKAAK